MNTKTLMCIARADTIGAMPRKSPTSPFGHETLDPSDKQNRVQDIFSSVSRNYDNMNDWMSFGLHYAWKKQAVSYTRLVAGDKALDLACGTCDITYYLYKRYGSQIDIIAADPNQGMLQQGRANLLDHGLHQNITFAQHFAEKLPYADNTFNLVISAFGFRNFTDKQEALREMTRVLRPAGQCIILEFSRPQSSVVQALYSMHADTIIPKMGAILSNNPAAYQYLVDSIETHPEPSVVTNMMQSAGLTNLQISPILSGLVCIHRGWKC
jgi:demethylmenaquinone methyltransferase/2-methoxy-6-polyprenyl-1,4-benzoquinol methylase